MIKNYEIGKYLVDDDFIFHMNKHVFTSKFYEHTHDHSEIIIILSGTANHVINKKKFPIKAGDVYVINGKNAHAFEDSRKLEFYNILFDPTRQIVNTLFLNEIAGYKSLFILEPYFRGIDNFNNMLCLNVSDLQVVTDILDKMYREFQGKSSGYQSMIAAYFLHLLTLLSRKYSYQDRAKDSALFQIANAVSFMESNILKEVILDDIVKYTEFSKRHFVRIFKDIYSISPIEYIIQLRIAHACKLLKDKTVNISTIAYRSGFSDSNYFSRQFRLKMGISPSEYRKN